ncbi:MAG: O-methyltransferase [Candidatus Kapabacteria bacterium]|nr:O-methyltransferase [Candidatus Kapabacteria bacterium]MDW8011897.1 O-methyltransferase [Bacteroidota bacterium]
MAQASQSTPTTPEILAYIQRHFSAEDEFLARLRQEAKARGFPEIWIAPEQGAFLQVLLRAVGARRVLEIGTLVGYSAIMMARALPPDGELVTLEWDPERAAFARQAIQRAGLAGKVRVECADAREWLRSFSPPEPLDFVFIDADKESYTLYVELCLPLLRVGGIICGDNACAWGQIASESDAPEVQALREFNLRMATHPQLQSCFVPLGDGMVLGLRRW